MGWLRDPALRQRGALRILAVLVVLVLGACGSLADTEATATLPAGENVSSAPRTTTTTLVTADVAAWAPVFAKVEPALRAFQDLWSAGEQTADACTDLVAAIEAAEQRQGPPGLDADWRNALGQLAKGARLCMVEKTVAIWGEAPDAPPTGFEKQLESGWAGVHGVVADINSALTKAQLTLLPTLPESLSAVVLGTSAESPAQQPITRSGVGPTTTPPFHLDAGDYDVHYAFGGDCFHSLFLYTQDHAYGEILGSSSAPVEAETTVEGVGDGVYVLYKLGGTDGACPWSVTLTPR